MKSVSKFVVAALAVSTAALSLPAEAGEGWAVAQGRGGPGYHSHHGGSSWNRGPYRPGWRAPYYYHHRRDDGAAIAAGIAGVVIGSAIVGGLNNPPPSTGYYGPSYAVEDPYPDYYVATSRPAASGEEAWVGSQEWYEYCSRRYRT
ncbi:MAG: hypothetical protein AB7L41_09000, partial [Flavobacteriaceae bacterium]